jgi:pimeloyl-ACP methyl ester carboxylesterase
MDISEIEPIIAGLATRYRVLAFDNRGAGRSDKPDAPYTIEMMAGDTVAVMRAAGIGRARVLGMSMGGRIALALALAEPDLVSRLILVSTGARVAESWRRRLTILLARMPRPQGKYPQPPHAFTRQMVASGGFDGTDRLREISVPALILHGRHDKTAPLALAEEMRAGIPNAALRTFPGGHVFMLIGQQQQFLDAVLQDAPDAGS